MSFGNNNNKFGRRPSSAGSRFGGGSGYGGGERRPFRDRSASAPRFENPRRRFGSESDSVANSDVQNSVESGEFQERPRRSFSDNRDNRGSGYAGGSRFGRGRSFSDNRDNRGSGYAGGSRFSERRSFGDRDNRSSGFGGDKPFRPGGFPFDESIRYELKKNFPEAKEIIFSVLEEFNINVVEVKNENKDVKKAEKKSKSSDCESGDIDSGEANFKAEVNNCSDSDEEDGSVKKTSFRKKKFDDETSECQDCDESEEKVKKASSRKKKSDDETSEDDKPVVKKTVTRKKKAE